MILTSRRSGEVGTRWGGSAIDASCYSLTMIFRVPTSTPFCGTSITTPLSMSFGLRLADEFEVGGVHQRIVGEYEVIDPEGRAVRQLRARKLPWSVQNRKTIPSPVDDGPMINRNISSFVQANDAPHECAPITAPPA